MTLRRAVVCGVVVMCGVGGIPLTSHADSGRLGDTLAEHSIYIGASVGSARASASANRLEQGLAADGFVATVTLDPTDTGWRLFAGWQFREHLAFEVGYVDFGQIDQSVATTTLDTTGFLTSLADRQPLLSSGMTFGLAGKVPFTTLGAQSGGVFERLHMVGRLGFYVWETRVRYTDGATTIRRLNSETDLTFGLGAGYSMSERLDLTLTWERFQSDTSVNYLNLGLLFNF